LAKLLTQEQAERLAASLQRIPPLAPKIAEAREKRWNKYPSVYLDQISHSEEMVEAIFATIGELAAPGRSYMES
jgi:hypothetical protein